MHLALSVSPRERVVLKGCLPDPPRTIGSRSAPTVALLQRNFHTMNAIQTSNPSLQPVEIRRRRESRQSRRQGRTHPYQLAATETTLKLTVNLVLSLAAVSALVQLLPYHRSGQEKLQQIRAQVTQTEGRVNQLRSEFSRSFDPQQAKTIMQEQSHRMDPTLRPIVWMEKGAGESGELTEQP